MPGAHDPRAANVLGAWALAVGDAIEDAASGGRARPLSHATALTALLAFADGRPIEMLRRALGLTHSRTVRIVDQLESERLVRRVRSTADRRETLIRLTAAGRREAEAILDRRDAALGVLLEPLGAEDQAALTELTGRLLTALTDSREHARRICRLCDGVACGHPEGRCPVTRGADAAEAGR